MVALPIDTSCSGQFYHSKAFSRYLYLYILTFIYIYTFRTEHLIPMSLDCYCAPSPAVQDHFALVANIWHHTYIDFGSNHFKRSTQQKANKPWCQRQTSQMIATVDPPIVLVTAFWCAGFPLQSVQQYTVRKVNAGHMSSGESQESETSRDPSEDFENPLTQPDWWSCRT